MDPVKTRAALNTHIAQKRKTIERLRLQINALENEIGRQLEASFHSQRELLKLDQAELKENQK